MGGRDDRAGRGEAADRGGWRDVGAREEGVGSDGSRGGERNQGRGEKLLLSAATAFLICYLYLHLPLFSLSCLLLFTFPLLEGEGQIINLCF